jgi:hypothetical protein
MQYITFSRIRVHKRPDEDSQFQQKYVAMTIHHVNVTS